MVFLHYGEILWSHTCLPSRSFESVNTILDTYACLFVCICRCVYVPLCACKHVHECTKLKKDISGTYIFLPANYKDIYSIYNLISKSIQFPSGKLQKLNFVLGPAGSQANDL